MSGQKPHLVGYVRVSTDDQSLDLQIDALVAYGVAREDIHEDIRSGGDTERRGLQAARKDCRPGDKLVVWKLDRLGRDVRELIATIDYLAHKGVELVVLTEHVDTTTPAGRMMFLVTAAFAQYERDLIVERTKAGLAYAASQGRKGGRRSIFTPDLKNVARRMLAAGKPLTEIATAVGFQSKSSLLRYLPELRRPPDVEEELG